MKKNNDFYEIYIEGCIGNVPNILNGYRYTNEYPYISSGESRETEKDKVYTGFKADVAEFNDIYMKDFHYSPNAVNKMGLGINKICAA